MAVRKPPEWVTQVDERILEYLENEQKVFPSELSDSGLVSDNSNYISQRLNLLKKAGFVESPRHGAYNLTSKGRKLIYGESDYRGVEDPSKNENKTSQS